VIQPTLRVKHRGFPKTELSVLNLISRSVSMPGQIPDSVVVSRDNRITMY
jgi:hypothetical protein